MGLEGVSVGGGLERTWCPVRSDAPEQRAASGVRPYVDGTPEVFDRESGRRQYAEKRGLEIVRTYADEGKSGLRIDGRAALKQLIADAQNGQAEFETILVYDISRWGRFQDADESAYYEYICKRGGIWRIRRFCQSSRRSRRWSTRPPDRRQAALSRSRCAAFEGGPGPEKRGGRRRSRQVGADQVRWWEWRQTRSEPTKPASIGPYRHSEILSPKRSLTKPTFSAQEKGGASRSRPLRPFNE